LSNPYERRRRAAVAIRTGDRRKTFHLTRCEHNPLTRRFPDVGRRKTASRDQLVKDGLSPAQISVACRGESDPLVPTADGVREAQNRWAEITF
jgi:hypothetical protein